MRFMFAIYHDEKELEALPEAEMQRLVDGSLEYDEALRQSGHYIVSDALQPSRTARTIRVRRGKVSTTDGPFAETKEQLGGSTSSRPGTSTRRARSPRGSRRRRSGSSRSARSGSGPTRSVPRGRKPAGVPGRKQGRALVVRRRAQRRHWTSSRRRAPGEREKCECVLIAWASPPVSRWAPSRRCPQDDALAEYTVERSRWKPARRIRTGTCGKS